MRTNADFQRMINHDKSPAEIVELYTKLSAEELRETVKELCDLIIVNDPIADNAENGSSVQRKAYFARSDAWNAMVELLGSEGLAGKAEQAVVDSNYTKLVMKNELTEAAEHFKRQGIKVIFEPLEDGLFMAVSAEDQTVNGKFYPKRKMLKSPGYKPVNMNEDFWL